MRRGRILGADSETVLAFVERDRDDDERAAEAEWLVVRNDREDEEG